MADTREQKYLAAFLDQVAEYFDREESVDPETFFVDPLDGQPTTARRLLRKIRLHEAMREVNRG